MIPTALTAAIAVMVLDAAKGVETQTRKLFEACRRQTPVLTFINKMDAEGRPPWTSWPKSKTF